MLKKQREKDSIFLLLSLCAFLFCLFGFVAGGKEVFSGLNKIFHAEAGLLTDYVAVGGLGAAFVNAGLAMVLAIGVTRMAGVKFSGLNVGVAFIVLGFAFFGKNVLNMIPIILGSYVCSKIRKEEFSKIVNIGLFATCLGPTVNYVAIYCLPNITVNGIGLYIFRSLLAFAVGMLIGVLVPIIAGLTSKIHNGMLIYNVGFASGILETAVAAVLKSLGHDFVSLNNVSSGNNRIVGIFLCALFGLMILSGLVQKGAGAYKNIFKYSGQSPCDYVKECGLPATLINMGLVGFICTGYVLVVNGELNGPILSGILATAGFAAYGMNIYNILWTGVGIVLLSFVSVWELNETGILLAVLFSSCICPIAGKYGPIWGIIAGMLHVSIVRNTAFEFGWLNLYNNGYAAGIVCLVLLPIIEFWHSFVRKQ